jgi:hypothetical protein
MSDAERARLHIVAKNRSRTDYEKINDLESEFAAVRSEATAAAEQRIAALEDEVEQLKERNADQYAALKKKWEDDWRAHNPDEAKAHDIIKRAAALLQSDREPAEGRKE